MQSSTFTKTHRRPLVGSLAAAALCLAIQLAAAADGGAQERYTRDMAICNSGQSNQDAATCRIEARNALAAARTGALTDQPGEYAGNAAQRCAALEGIELRACEARMRGEGTVEGSVAGGGLLRENVTEVPAK